MGFPVVAFVQAAVAGGKLQNINSTARLLITFEWDVVQSTLFQLPSKNRI